MAITLGPRPFRSSRASRASLHHHRRREVSRASAGPLSRGLSWSVCPPLCCANISFMTSAASLASQLKLERLVWLRVLLAVFLKPPVRFAGGQPGFHKGEKLEPKWLRLLACLLATSSEGKHRRPSPPRVCAQVSP